MIAEFAFGECDFELLKMKKRITDLELIRTLGYEVMTGWYSVYLVYHLMLMSTRGCFHFERLEIGRRSEFAIVIFPLLGVP